LGIYCWCSQETLMPLAEKVIRILPGQLDF
jgi:hypothetical protein